MDHPRSGGPAAGHSPGERHVPVLAQRCVDLLAPALGARGATVVDATLGMGGHSDLLLETFPSLRVLGIDRDPQALDLASERLARHRDRFTPVHAVYDEVSDVVATHVPGPGGGTVQGILFDLGVSSLQLDEPDRGFAYSRDAPLDMRMDQTRGTTAADLIASAPEAELRRILSWYGEEKFAGRIAAAIVRTRDLDPITHSAALVDLVRGAIPAAARRTGGNPAKRTFQALRIAVNAELDVLERAIPAAIDSIGVGGRIVVLSYQSLEDRLVKRAFTAGATSTAPPDLPVELPDHAPFLRLLTRGAERADAEEIERNPRAASVRLRAVERIRPLPKEVS
ncbi:16S rRNA (cytosine(1402)-N(4))-methyltransferase RsmH [Pseudactinotalea sp. HY160]|uniref:16S rRNA (cytosine(1402)-N(4))-methyltransferase RsmH n=1 Tax=Pseudactinotalea sp. HY160 TaxID=2654490 RepID=UPI00128C5C63|nr:16S rRNA (cytosine(1402)-N(4))-methyltransferase RsmH [Pseudactinotalea sp. HY160]MPV49526.1 16S rRNA (cytosine(1402)-N(4))-methyltransferase RsmH [Pseudactinotalea sp. HY160]